MIQLKNWDNKTWLSSAAYINAFNSFLLKKKKLNKNSKILDIGCGRGKIIGSLSRKLKLSNKPIGIDPIVHKDVDKSIDFRDQDIFKFFKVNNYKFDLILETLNCICRLFPKAEPAPFLRLFQCCLPVLRRCLLCVLHQ